MDLTSAKRALTPSRIFVVSRTFAQSEDILTISPDHATHEMVSRMEGFFKYRYHPYTEEKLKIMSAGSNIEIPKE